MNLCIKIPAFRQGDATTAQEPSLEPQLEPQPDEPQSSDVSNPTESKRETPGCLRDEDCAKKGQICLQGACVGGCRTAKDCPAGQLCKANLCAGCTEDSQCPTSQLCLAQVCKDGDCRKQEDCKGGLLCANNRCSPCTADSQCENGVRCIKGACTPGGCQVRKDCPAGLLCKKNKCEKCADDGECASGELCIGDVCLRADCRENAGCQGGKVCKRRLCVACSDTTDCTKGEVCAKGICKAGNCVDNNECSGGQVCISNTCANCSLKSHCASNEVCDAGYCKPGNCTTNGNCQGGQVCTNFQCSPCTKNTECGSGNVCVNSACVPGNCTSAADCAQGLLCKSLNCVGCTKDQECPTALPSCVGGKCTGIATKDHRGALRWADKKHAKDCNQYRKPPPGYAASTTNGLYWIQPNTAREFQVYCDMTFHGGGWTLILKLRGTSSSYTYHSGHWVAPSVSGRPHFDNKEAKLASFNTVAVKEIWIRFRDPIASTQANDLRSIVVEKSASSFLAIMKGGKNQLPAKTVTVANWRSLMKAPSLQSKCNKVGFNLEAPSGDGYRLRMGIQTGDQADCSTVDSFIGIGSGKGPVFAGNWAKNGADRGDKDVKVFVYLLVRAP